MNASDASSQGGWEALAPCAAPLQRAVEAREQFRATGDPVALDSAVGAWREVWGCPAFGDAPEHIQLAVLSDTGIAHLRRFELSSNVEDLNEALAIIEDVVSRSPESAPSVPGRLTNLGLAKTYRFQLNGDIRDSDAGLAAFRLAMAQAGRHAADTSGMLGNLALGLFTRFQHLGEESDLDDAIAALREAVDVAPAGSARRLDLLGSLVTALLARYERRRVPEDMDPVIAAYQHAADTTLDGSPTRAECLSSLGRAYHARFTMRLDPRDLEAAADQYERALDAVMTLGVNPAPQLGTLGSFLLERYELTGDETSLNRAVAVLAESVAKTPEGASARSNRLGNLGLALRHKFIQTGNLQELDAAIATLRAALAAAGRNAEALVARYNNLGVALRDRYYRNRDAGDLESAIAAFRSALDTPTPAASIRAGGQSNVGLCLRERFSRTGDQVDLDNAIAAFQEAVQLTHADPRDAAGHRNNLAMGLISRFNLGGGSADLESAITAFQNAVDAMPLLVPSRPAILGNLARALGMRFDRSGTSNDASIADATFRQAVAQGADVDPGTALGAARSWLQWSLGRAAWAEADQAGRVAMKLWRQLVRSQLGATEKASWLRDAQGLAAEAAYAAARCGDLHRALETIEAGQARLLDEQLRGRMTDRRLAVSRDGDLHALVTEYDQALAEWHRLQATFLADFLADVPWARSAVLDQTVRRARSRLEAAVVALQAQPPFADLFGELGASDILSFSTQVPLIYLATTEHGGLALLAHAGEVEVLWLDFLATQVLRPQLLGTSSDHERPVYFDAYLAWRDAESATGGVERHSAHSQWRQALDDLTARLWSLAMHDVVELLERKGLTRIAVVPCGFLSLLPWHAAWRPDHDAPDTRVYVADIVALSYAQNARSLISARERLPAFVPAADRLCLVVQADADGRHQLAHAEDEGRAVLASWSGHDGPRPRTLWHLAASRAQVAEAMHASSVFHFAGHAFADLGSPLDGGLVLAGDEILSVADIQDRSLDLRLAVLSACETATAGTILPDEVISLPTAFAAAGAIGVIGSLWPVSDASTATLIGHFYDSWRRKGLDPAEALRQAQARLRATPGYGHPHCWAAFTFTGL